MSSFDLLQFCYHALFNVWVCDPAKDFNHLCSEWLAGEISDNEGDTAEWSQNIANVIFNNLLLFKRIHAVSIVPFFNKSTTVIMASDEKMCRCREGMDRWWAPCFLLPEPRPKYIPNSNQLFTVILNIPLTRNPTHHLDDA